MSTMNHQTASQKEKIVDQLIHDHFAQLNESDDQGRPISPFSAADKLHLANRAGADLEMVERRLKALCDELPPADHLVAVPRYCLKV